MPGEASDDLISFSDLILDCHVEIGKSGAGPGDELLESVCAVSVLGGGTTMSKIRRREQLIDSGGVSLVEYLIRDAAGQSLVGLGGSALVGTSDGGDRRGPDQQGRQA